MCKYLELNYHKNFIHLNTRIRQEDGGEVGGNRAQLEYLADRLRKRVNSQWNPSLYEVWRPKIVEVIEKQ